MSRKTTERGIRADGRRGVFTPGRIAVLVLAALALIFIFENTQETRVRVIIPEVTLPLWTALLGTAVVGALFGAYFMRRRR
ncbi:LapA family protein [Streptomyces griseoviridis]|uniref:DUF1049 domain-containing protein n=2 Tax=Streptomyces TaxID=1883 RepID=A0A3S9Z8J6_STRGD|nr:MULTISPECIES: LapA family protein [Streptomyces]AZS84010.1 LapA family protein [Streptomyces griseoviridis]MDH6696911.1 putative integral membrane protein [Streptomyces sp. MAA16]MDT0472844.1 LapA family protein [Streptomyces sp. DSM 41014]QCN89137.1 DUF1049 domain-containing protein [Streptomyces griseoviridis]